MKKIYKKIRNMKNISNIFLVKKSTQPDQFVLFTYDSLHIKFLSLFERKPAKISCERKWATKLPIK